MLLLMVFDPFVLILISDSLYLNTNESSLFNSTFHKANSLIEWQLLMVSMISILSSICFFRISLRLKFKAKIVSLNSN